MALGIGSLLAGRYEITAPIATGGMGEVWKARDQVLDRIVAAKVLKSEYTNDPSFLARFRNEARHTAALSHPNIASVYDYGETTDDSGTQTLAFLVMEFVEGQPLVTILHEEGRLPVDWTLHVLSQSADGLSAAHRAGVVHRDIKPGNLIVRPDGVVKLTDFGIAQARDAAPLTRTGMVVGTAQYLSPEQAQGMEVNAASDVYSLGVVGYECLTGARPFDGASQVAIALAHINRPPPPLPADIPAPVRLLVERALAKDPADRFADGGAFADAVRRVAAGGSVAAPAAAAAGAAAAAAAFSPPTAPTQIVDTAAAADRTQIFATPAAGMPAVSPATAGRPMPPLHARPDEDEEWLPEEEQPPGNRRRWAWVAAAVVLLLLLGGAVGLLMSGSGGQDDTGVDPTTTPSSTSAAPTAVVVDAAALIGRPVDEVAAELDQAGLVPEQRAADDDLLAGVDQVLDAGDVAAVTPSGSVPVGGTVTLYYAAEPWDPDAEVEEEEPAPEEEEEEPVETPAPTSQPSTTPSTSATPTTAATTSATTSPPLGGSSAPAVTSPTDAEPTGDGAQATGENQGQAAPTGAGGQ
ncbi:serine/threonine-protein kinase [Blastococcus saxobsidens]|uniref:non-specific serine/threonine protein kinase n=1 Tax=Blastococcus saxobsidens TaxID=138336 RepID=A0A4Q7YB82_9ACTN|nr:serine/threonine-protein kinase [Blastococcus saxobsidens]RZU33834.1 serine/threonine-protein kinase [Blastococcus saxobsidens]